MRRPPAHRPARTSSRRGQMNGAFTIDARAAAAARDRAISRRFPDVLASRRRCARGRHRGCSHRTRHARAAWGRAPEGSPMSDRRRASRFMLTESDATLRVMQDVYVEQANATQITIVTDAPLGGGRRLADRAAARGRRSSGAARARIGVHAGSVWRRPCVTGSCCRCCSGEFPASPPAWEWCDE